MRTCPFHDCDKQIPDYMFACARHWRALSGHEKGRINNAYADYLADRIDVEALRAVQQDVLGDRGDAHRSGGD